MKKLTKKQKLAEEKRAMDFFIENYPHELPIPIIKELILSPNMEYGFKKYLEKKDNQNESH